MFKLFKKRKKQEKPSFIKDITYHTITYTIMFDHVEAIKEMFDPEKIAYINYNPIGKYFTVYVNIKEGD